MEFMILTRRRQALELLLKNGDIGIAEYTQLSAQYEALLDKLTEKLKQGRNPEL
jgi:ATP-dependent exoDNAse (exonuclease V) alpha subunit